jgi:predicted transglutaminase-like cysteine proteinase
MNSITKFAGLALAAVVISTSVPAVAQAGQYAPVGTTITQVAGLMPPGMRDFCASYRSQCRAGGAPEVTMTQDLMAAMQRINNQVNRAIRPRNETGDVWQLNPAAGDCEDYAVSKRAALIRQGVAPSALRIAFTKTRRGEPHAVLVVRTSQGDYVLDNLSTTVKTVAQSGYRIRAMSGANPTSWSRAG